MTDGCTTGGTFDPLNVKSDAEALMWQWRLHWHEPGFWCPVTSFEQFALLLGANIYQLRRAGSTKVYNCTGTTTYAAAPVSTSTGTGEAGAEDDAAFSRDLSSEEVSHILKTWHPQNDLYRATAEIGRLRKWIARRSLAPPAEAVADDLLRASQEILYRLPEYGLDREPYFFADGRFCTDWGAAVDLLRRAVAARTSPPQAEATRTGKGGFPKPSWKGPDADPCGECHLKLGETCDICGALDKRTGEGETSS